MPAPLFQQLAAVETADVFLADAQSPVPYYNQAILARPLRGAGDPVLDDVAAFFAGSTTATTLLSMWPTPDLAARGWILGGHPAFVARGPGPHDGRTAPGVEVRLAATADDLHAADAPSLLLLRFMALELAAAPILIVGCYRDTEVGPGHPLAEALPELTREGVVTRISLKGLGRAETARLLELTLGRPAPDELIDRVHAETEGNPLFASEIARPG